MRNDNKVLVAGAGPVGLVAACRLAHAGVPVMVFEAERELPVALRASTFQPPTLDLLADLGVVDELIAQGRITRTVQYRDRDGWRVDFDLGLLKGATAHPFRLQCEQYKLSRILVERLRSLPHAEVLFGARLVGVEQTGSGLQAEIERHGGRKRFNGRWLIGADGGRSAVREALGIRLEGFTWPERFLVASTPYDFAAVLPHLADVTYVADPEEWYFLLRLPAVWRAMFPVAADEDDAHALSESSVQRRLQRVHARSGAYEVVHRTLYSVHQRVASRYRSGRAFLAGDAAHLNNPLGGLGMNGGIHDAANLAQKLLRVILNGEDDEGLDAYEAERRPIALEYVNNITIANKRNLELRDAERRRQWRGQLERTAASPSLAREHLLRASMLLQARVA